MKRSWTKAVFKSVQPYVSEQKRSWFEDMRSEALHISSGWRRFFFVMGCLRFCAVMILRDRIGVRLIGQILIATGVLSFCIGGVFMLGPNIPSEISMLIYLLMFVYAIAGCLVVVNLQLMKRYAMIAALGFLLFGLSMFWTDILSEQAFVRALFLEATLIMIALYVAASFVSWIEDKTYV